MLVAAALLAAAPEDGTAAAAPPPLLLDETPPRGSGFALAAGPAWASLYGLPITGVELVASGTRLHRLGEGARSGLQIEGDVLIGQTPAGLRLTRFEGALLIVLAQGPVHFAVGPGIGNVSLRGATEDHDAWFLGGQAVLGVGLGSLAGLEPFLELRAAVTPLVNLADLPQVGVLLGFRPARP
jgi:hypothetical protein